METFKYVLGFVVVMVLAILLIAFLGRQNTWFVADIQPDQQTPATSTDTQAELNTISTPEITFTVPANFGLAVTPDQVLKTGYIPPCDEGFDYCLYYNASTYDGTNFESAGVRVERRSDLATADVCLNTQPAGYTGLVPQVRAAGTYSVSTFGPLGDAGAGHSASGEVHRLSFDGTCYEFGTRIGTAQFQNYPEGTIREFTVADRDALERELVNILNSVRITGGAAVSF